MTALKQFVCGWLYRIVTLPGWHRWLALAAAAFLFMLSALWLTQGTDYREDPSALVPRSADLYAETRDLAGFLKTAGAWTLWREDRRGTESESRNALERELAALVSARVGGLPVNPPLRWMGASRGAAWSVSRNGAEGAPGTESWALYLKLENPGDALGEIEVEPGMTLETTQGERSGDGVFAVRARDGTAAYAGVVGPWLILSGDAKLPEFALEAKGKPGVSLAGSGMLPPWRRAAGLRGVVNPSYTAAAALPALGGGFAADWLSPGARIAYTSTLGKNGGVEINFTTVELREQSPGTGLWPLVSLVVALVALASLAVVLGIVLVMIGWGGWFKAMAVKTGAEPAEAPEKVETSPAFAEDAAAASESAAREEPEMHEADNTCPNKE